MYVYVFKNMFVPVCGYQRLTLDILKALCFHLNQDLSELTHFGNHLAPGIHTTSPECWDSGAHHTHLVSTWVMRIWGHFCVCSASTLLLDCLCNPRWAFPSSSEATKVLVYGLTLILVTLWGPHSRFSKSVLIAFPFLSCCLSLILKEHLIHLYQ